MTLLLFVADVVTAAVVVVAAAAIVAVDVAAVVVAAVAIVVVDCFHGCRLIQLSTSFLSFPQRKIVA